jgi:hypothetical protein
LAKAADRLDIEGTRAIFEISSQMADELVAFSAESEDLEQDDEPEVGTDLAEFLNAGLAHVAVVRALTEQRLGPIEDPDDVHAAIAARVSGALHPVKEARDLMEAAVRPWVG